jgi:hypothetical protein
MSERIHALAQHLLGKSSIEECSLEELQHITKRFPFFAPAQFLLLEKLKAAGSPDAAAQQRKAVLYFHDPLQFDHFLSADDYSMDDLFAEEKEASNEMATTSFAETPDASLAFINSTSIEPEIQEEEPAVVRIEEPADVPPTEANFVFPDPDILSEEIEAPAEPPVLPVEPLPEEPPVTLTTKEEVETVLQPNTENKTAETLIPASTDEVEVAAPETNAAPVLQSETTTPAASGDILFEPYHTVDYFASQGIKVSANDFSKDKLSKQLRSFTEWLKVMKRLPAAEMAQSPQSTAEKSVANMANHSVEESEIVTEAMAEVWAKQGAHQKAIETYNKLSLLNPSKKAYFAAKIENLKGS